MAYPASSLQKKILEETTAAGRQAVRLFLHQQANIVPQFGPQQAEQSIS